MTTRAKTWKLNVTDTNGIWVEFTLRFELISVKNSTSSMSIQGEEKWNRDRHPIFRSIFKAVATQTVDYVVIGSFATFRTVPVFSELSRSILLVLEIMQAGSTDSSIWLDDSVYTTGSWQTQRTFANIGPKSNFCAVMLLKPGSH